MTFDIILLQGTPNSDVTISITNIVSNPANTNSGNNLFYIDPKSPARLLLSQPFTSDLSKATQYTVSL